MKRFEKSIVNDLIILNKVFTNFQKYFSTHILLKKDYD